MTDKKYLDDSYLKELNSVITEVNENGIILESTVFYPRGGGQPGDSGFILKNGKMYKISDTTKDGDVVIHHQESLDPELSAGDTIKCQIDWDKRYAHMRYHTAIHLIDAVVNLNPGYRGLITGSQMIKEEWGNDGHWMCVLEVPAGMYGDIMGTIGRKAGDSGFILKNGKMFKISDTTKDGYGKIC